MSERRPRVLLVGEGASLAHVGRPLALAGDLDRARFDVHMATDVRHERFVGSIDGVTPHELPSIDGATFVARVEAGGATYTSAELDDYLAHELALLDRVRPDIVIGDFRWTLPVSAALRGVPSATIVNAHWSPAFLGAEAVRPVDGRPATLPGNETSRPDRRRLASRLHAIASRRRPDPAPVDEDTSTMNELRARHGLPPLDGFADLVCAATYTLYVEPEGLVPTGPLPGHHRFLGGLTWSPALLAPSWWPPAPGRPIVYVTLGSTGPGERLAAFVDAIAELRVTVVVATAGRASVPAREHVLVADYLPGHLVAGASSVVVGNGGSATTYQALAAGTPVVGLWSNPDQRITAEIVERHGAGRAAPAESSPAQAAALVAATLDSPAARTAASAIAERFVARAPASVLAAVIDEALGSRA